MFEPGTDNGGGQEATISSVSPSVVPSTTRILRLVALAGTGLVLLWNTTSLTRMAVPHTCSENVAWTNTISPNSVLTAWSLAVTTPV